MHVHPEEGGEVLDQALSSLQFIGKFQLLNNVIMTTERHERPSMYTTHLLSLVRPTSFYFKSVFTIEGKYMFVINNQYE